jgi:hypothetical protein
VARGAVQLRDGVLPHHFVPHSLHLCCCTSRASHH